MKISVAIPNYNGYKGLRVLLPELVKLDFNHIYLLDDNSTDNSVQYAGGFKEVRVVRGKKNLGAGGNRNRVLEKPTGEIIWFVDADMELVTKNQSAFNKIKKAFQNRTIGAIGSRILSKKGKPMHWNYGFEMHPMRDAVIPVLENMAKKFKNNKEVVDYVRKISLNYFYNLEMDNGDNKSREVEWSAEGNFFIRTSLFKKLKGFDGKMRYHETQELCHRIKDLNKKIMFFPFIKTRHLEIDVRGSLRRKEVDEAARYFYKKHWGMPDKVITKFENDYKGLIKRVKS